MNNIEWKPIESAPKDGTLILVAHYNRTWRTKEVKVSLAVWDEDKYGNPPYPHWDYGRNNSYDMRESLQQVAFAWWSKVPSPPHYAIVEDTIVLENL